MTETAFDSGFVTLRQVQTTVYTVLPLCFEVILTNMKKENFISYTHWLYYIFFNEARFLFMQWHPGKSIYWIQLHRYYIDCQILWTLGVEVSSSIKVYECISYASSMKEKDKTINFSVVTRMKKIYPQVFAKYFFSIRQF